VTTPQDVQRFTGPPAFGGEGSEAAAPGQVYLDEQTGLPLWITVATGMFGTRQSAMPPVPADWPGPAGAEGPDNAQPIAERADVGHGPGLRNCAP
jgi:hypothetical protein